MKGDSCENSKENIAEKRTNLQEKMVLIFCTHMHKGPKTNEILIILSFEDNFMEKSMCIIFIHINAMFRSK